MRIQKVAIIFDDKVRPDTTGFYCRRALGKLVEIEHFLPSEVSRIPRKAFDLYLNIDDGLEYRLPPDLHPSAWWAIDTHLNYTWSRDRSQSFDFIFTAQKDGAEQMRRDGIASAQWVPLACDPEIHCKMDIPKQFEICFVGNIVSGQRAELIDLIKRNFPNTFVGRRFFEEMAHVYSASHIIFNRSLRNDINMRVFEALSCGSLLLTNDLRDNGQEELFQDGLHLATYRDANELLEKIKYYLLRKEARERIAATGREQVLARHTYQHRMAYVLEEVERKLNGGAKLGQRQHQDLQPLLCNVDTGMALLTLIPRSAEKVLHLGCGDGKLGQAIKSRQKCHVIGIEFNTEKAALARRLLDEVLVGDVEQIDLDFTPSSFDAIVCGHILEKMRDPSDFLRMAHRWLKPDGVLTAAFDNPRYHRNVRGLLEGHWSQRSLRFFTHREIEKLFYRAAFCIDEIRTVPEQADDGWHDCARAGNVKVGNLHVAGLPEQEAEEFYATQFLVAAGPVEIPDRGLTSIVILTHNEVDYTRKCLESIRQYTEEPYELIVVDNASTDCTDEYLESIKNLRLIRNRENLGFPKAANQGIRAASGRQILLLNNDCIVTTGWLRRMLRALHSDPKIGLVGPCSNFVSGEQQVEIRYDDLVGLDGFAWDFGKSNNRRLEGTDRLVGFCLLIRRELIDAIGLLDEDFGLGCFEDDDYCRRALAAGFHAVIARDAFVHHFGGRTFIGMGIDFGSLINHNQQLLVHKWRGASRATPQKDSVGGGAIRPKGPETAKQPPVFGFKRIPKGGLLLERKDIEISLCMIVRDNARTIEATLKSIKPWVDEMIVVDTGSNDGTPDIARGLGARVFHFPWCDSFSAARNESICHARGRWIFWMDSDDTINAQNGAKLRKLVRQATSDVLGFVISVHCPGTGTDGQDDVTVVTHVKLFRNLPDMRFEGRIHEQILGSLRRAGGKLEWSDAFVVHSGYDHSAEGQEKKKQRDLHLLGLELKEQPDHPFTLFNLGMTYADIGRYREAIRFLNRSIENSESSESHVRKAYAILVYVHSAIGNLPGAWQACEKGLRLFPEDVELRFRRGILFHSSGRLQEAVLAYQSVLDRHETDHFFSLDRGIKSFKTRCNLALVYLDMGELDRAEEQWRKIVAEVPNWSPGWRGLGEVLIKQGKLEEAAKIKKRLMADKRLHFEGVLIESQLALAKGRVDFARQVLEKAKKKNPSDLQPLQALCRLLFEHGEPKDAEFALRELVDRDSNDALAYHNLGIVCRRLGKTSEAIAAFQDSLRLQRQSVNTHLQLGYALCEASRLPEATASWKEVLRLQPDNTEASKALQSATETTQIPSKLTGHEYPVRLQLPDIPVVTRGEVDRAIVKDIWERDVYGVRRVDQPPATVVDLGAHVGAFSVRAHQAWPKARIIACEPDSDNFQLLQQNVQTCKNVETIRAAIVAEEVNEVDFFQVTDKAHQNSGGGSCSRAEPGAVKIRVSAMSVCRLWQSMNIGKCDFLKIDCEGLEIPILGALAQSGYLPDVAVIAGEWHSIDSSPPSVERVQSELRSILEKTHQVQFSPHRGGREGYFIARSIKDR
jgi:FkbM family methyltransferase